MFQHDQEGKVKEVYLIDHQVTKYGNPAQDLYFFLMTSPQLNLKVEQFDYLIRYYHENLIQNVQLLKYTGFVPNLKELQIILHKHPIHGKYLRVEKPNSMLMLMLTILYFSCWLCDWPLISSPKGPH